LLRTLGPPNVAILAILGPFGGGTAIWDQGQIPRTRGDLDPIQATGGRSPHPVELGSTPDRDYPDEQRRRDTTAVWFRWPACQGGTRARRTPGRDRGDP
jgi:hypothetical protein